MLVVIDAFIRFEVSVRLVVGGAMANLLVVWRCLVVVGGFVGRGVVLSIGLNMFILFTWSEVRCWV